MKNFIKQLLILSLPKDLRQYGPVAWDTLDWDFFWKCCRGGGAILVMMFAALLTITSNPFLLFGFGVYFVACPLSTLRSVVRMSCERLKLDEVWKEVIDRRTAENLDLDYIYAEDMFKEVAAKFLAKGGQ
jgi:hypothetical protein